MSHDLTSLVADSISASSWRMETLQAVRNVALPDWAIGAGFVRNAVWDRLHGYPSPTPLADIDVLFFDPLHLGPDVELEIEWSLRAALPKRPWSVRNQARMHLRNGDRPYRSTADAMSFWLETPTCVAVRFDDDDHIAVIALFGLSDLVDMRVAPTATGYRKIDRYRERMAAKNWPLTWPKVKVIGLG